MNRYQGKHTAGEPAREKGQKKKRTSRFTRQQKLLIALCVVLALALCVVAAYKALIVKPELPSVDGNGKSDAETVDYGDGVQPKVSGKRKSEDYYTVLILCRDTGGGGNTDTMLLASYDVTNQKATVMSIPRDTMVNVSWDVKKINSVYNYYGGGEKGIQAVYKEVSQLVGFEPDYQVVVEWEAVGEIVDAIGGVWFDVPYDMHYNDPYQDLVINQAKGYRKLSGSDAMQVIRWRKNNGKSGIGDSGRMEIQQNFLKAVIQQMLTIKNVGNLNKIAKVFQNNVETDLSFQNIMWFAQKAIFGGLSVDNVEFLTMPWKGTYAYSRYYHQNLDYVVPIADELLEIVNEKLSPFVEPFTLSDLDIMSVNSDGSLSSTTGHVEDTKATTAPSGSGSKPSQNTGNTSGGTTAPQEPEENQPVQQPENPGQENPGGGTQSGSSGETGGESGGTAEPGTGGATEPEHGSQEPEQPSGGEENSSGGSDVEWTTVPSEPDTTA